MERLTCPICGGLVMEIDPGESGGTLPRPIVIRARCRNHRRCHGQPMLTWQIRYPGTVERVSLTGRVTSL